MLMPVLSPKENAFILGGRGAMATVLPYESSLINRREMQAWKKDGPCWVAYLL